MKGSLKILYVLHLHTTIGHVAQAVEKQYYRSVCGPSLCLLHYNQRIALTYSIVFRLSSSPPEEETRGKYEID